MPRKFSFGEYRVGVDFNPSGDKYVARIKQLAAELIDVIDQVMVSTEVEPKDEVFRLKHKAMTAIEEGAMWAVKAATKKSWE